MSALLVWPYEMFGQIYGLLCKSHCGPWWHEVLVPVGNAQIVLRIKYIYLLWHRYECYRRLS